jgi:hypothetical protein
MSSSIFVRVLGDVRVSKCTCVTPRSSISSVLTLVATCASPTYTQGGVLHLSSVVIDGFQGVRGCRHVVVVLLLSLSYGACIAKIKSGCQSLVATGFREKKPIIL